jgi:hypothetical protein
MDVWLSNTQLTMDISKLLQQHLNQARSFDKT